VSTVDQDLDVPAGTAQLTHAAGDAEVTSARLARVGDIEVRRLLPLRKRRSVGAWCFIDHYGPESLDRRWTWCA
jgi:quercetin 2,3-dioxygenase